MPSPLAPGLLIASPPMGDPNFDRTVVLLAMHNDDGALGFVVNRHAPMKVGELLGFAGYEDDSTKDETPVFLGGPVQPSSGWIVFEGDAHDGEEGVIKVGDRVRVTSSRTAFDRLAEAARSDTPTDDERRLVVLGYSGWGPGQLEGEIAVGAWLPVPLREEILFDVAVDDRWERAYAVLGLSPAWMMTMRSAGDA